MKIEYRVRPVTRYVITRFQEGNGSRECGGEHDSAETAHAVAYALARSEHELLGFDPGDERIMYPEPI